MNATRVLLVAASLAFSRVARAQQPLIGCWKLEPGRFSVIGTIGVDPGQTTLPSLVRFDTAPGRLWNGESIGRRVRAFPDTNRTTYRDGYYLTSGRDSVRVEWTNSVVGMTLTLRVDSLVMRGRASAWTDYTGHEEASLVLRRVACPGI